jgi:pimeloyl-ACP methyl ester carboxylesterase
MGRIVFVHGSVEGGDVAWAAQQPLAARHELVVLHRPGFPPGEVTDRVDYAEHGAWVAGLLARGDHLVGHSAGAIVAMLAAAAPSAEVASLTLLEPPAFTAAEGDARADELSRRMQSVWQNAAPDPRDFLLAFFAAFMGGVPPLPNPLPPTMLQGARMLQVEQGPWEVELPLRELAARRLPTLVVTGRWSPALDAIANAIVAALRARHEVVPGAGHSIQLVPAFNDVLESFVAQVEEHSRAQG